MKNYIVRQGQGLLDIALEVYGSVEAVYWLVEDNGLADMNTVVAEGDTLVLRNGVVDMQVRDFLKDFAPLGTM